MPVLAFAREEHTGATSKSYQLLVGEGGRPATALLSQLLMRSILSHSFPDPGCFTEWGLLFILLEYLVLHSEAELLFEQTADIDLPFGGGVG